LFSSTYLCRVLLFFSINIGDFFLDSFVFLIFFLSILNVLNFLIDLDFLFHKVFLNWSLLIDNINHISLSLGIFVCLFSQPSDKRSMLYLLMLTQIEPDDLLRADESHSLIAILLVLLAVLLLHLANLCVLASLDVSLPHHGVVVFLSSLFATLSGFDLSLLLLLLIGLHGLFVGFKCLKFYCSLKLRSLSPTCTTVIL
jgi:hypothetical protein